MCTSCVCELYVINEHDNDHRPDMVQSASKLAELNACITQLLRSLRWAWPYKIFAQEQKTRTVNTVSSRSAYGLYGHLTVETVWAVWYRLIKSSWNRGLSGSHKCNTTTIQMQYKNFFLYCSCIALVRTRAIQRCNTSFLQLAENLQATCSSCKKNLYWSCTALVRTAAIQPSFCVMLL